MPKARTSTSVAKARNQHRFQKLGHQLPKLGINIGLKARTSSAVAKARISTSVSKARTSVAKARNQHRFQKLGHQQLPKLGYQHRFQKLGLICSCQS
ncbi:hypothetical protein [Candidatus Epulonipiscium viviparus]|uniref:hypothetical protein n=1 Tax=Candidatus Epulonipiscium viviparus TaxID=420336 RepID=UPI0027380711|nr:hypothetical protein [Candidatus Epulopiscium viviparus]